MITLTDKAVNEVKRIIEEMNEGKKYLRIAVKGGGCSGFQFSLAIDDLNEGKDTILEQNGLSIVIDKRSALYVEGTVVDFLDDINKRGFAFNNPKATGRCGCGSSFSM